MGGWFVLGATLAAFIMGLGGSALAEEGGHVLALGSGEISGAYFPEAGAVCRLVNKDRARHGLHCLVEPSSGSLANLAALRNGDSQLAIVQSRILGQAVQGGNGVAKEPASDLRTLMTLQGEALVVLVAPGAKIKRPADLKGKRLTLGHAGSFQRMMADALLAAESIGPADLAGALEMDVGQVAGALCRNEIDGAVLTGLHPMAEVQEAIDECGAALLPLKDSGLDAYLKANPAFVRISISEETYGGLNAKLPTFGLGAVLVASTKLPVNHAYEVVKAVFDNLAFFRTLHPLLGGLEKRQMASDAMVAPLHDGALRYFRENNLP